MKPHTKEFSRFVINGLVASVVHYSVLTVCLGILDFKSAGLANLVAACFGVTTSFLGSRYFVFKGTKVSILRQAVKFSGLYGTIALLHGLFLWVWTDVQSLDYRLGFLFASGIQVLFSYFGNKYLVFKT